MAFHKELQMFDNMLKNRRGQNVLSILHCYDEYSRSKNFRNSLRFGHYPHTEAILISWDTAKGMNFRIISPDEFIFTTFKKPGRSKDEGISIRFDITPEFFEQIKFVVDLNTLQYKSIEVLQSIAHQYFEAINKK